MVLKSLKKDLKTQITEGIGGFKSNRITKTSDLVGGRGQKFG